MIGVKRHNEKFDSARESRELQDYNVTQVLSVILVLICGDVITRCAVRRITMHGVNGGQDRGGGEVAGM